MRRAGYREPREGTVKNITRAEKTDGFDVIEQLRVLSVETERFVERFAQRHALHSTDLNALAVILDATRHGEPVTAGQLGARLNLSSPATSALLDRLGRAELVTRLRSSTDRRKVELHLTDAAARVGEALLAPLARRVADVVEALEPAGRVLVARFLRDVAAATVAAREEHRREEHSPVA
jgi:DNA-binding MarR family transcriptional regulator